MSDESKAILDIDCPTDQDDLLFDQFITSAMQGKDSSDISASLRQMKALRKFHLEHLADIVEANIGPRKFFAKYVVFQKLGGAGRPSSTKSIEFEFDPGSSKELFEAIAAGNRHNLAYQLRILDGLDGKPLSLFADLFDPAAQLPGGMQRRLAFQRHRAGGQTKFFVDFKAAREVRKLCAANTHKMQKWLIPEIQKVLLAKMQRRVSRNTAIDLFKRYSGLAPKK